MTNDRTVCSLRCTQPFWINKRVAWQRGVCDRAMEDKIAALERQVLEIKTATAIKEAAFEKQKEDLLDYIQKEFAVSKLAINEVVESAKTEFAAQRSNLQVLYEATTLKLAGNKATCEKF